MADKIVYPSNEQLQKLECPFTWITKDITKQDDKNYHLNDDEDDFPLLQLIRRIMSVYVDTKAGTKLSEILKELKDCNEFLVALEKNNHPEISTDVVSYVLQSTKCFVFKQLKQPEKVKQIFDKIKKDWRMNSKERSTLIACRSLCWSKYHRIGSTEAEKYIREAIEENPNCELWYFILAKNLRRLRRDATLKTGLSKEEISCFQKAYKMSSNPAFGVFLAQMYRESRRMPEAEDVYNEIFEKNPSSTTILLRLALGFIRLRQYTKAKTCLDRVEAVSPNNMYLHYRGIYYLNRKNYKEAAKYLKEAMKDDNLPAANQYLECALMLDKSFDVVQYLRDMVLKYSRLPKEQTQPLLLNLAVAYWEKNRDIPNAIENFLKAVEMNPASKSITNYFILNAIPISEKNLYKLLIRDVVPMVLHNKGNFDESCINNAKKLKDYCDRYFAENFAKTLNSFSNVGLRN